MSFRKLRTLQTLSLILLAIIIGVPALGFQALPVANAKDQPVVDPVSNGQSAPRTGNPLYLPVVANGYPWNNPFGAESGVSLITNTQPLGRAVDLNLGWMRMNTRVSWADLQPAQGGPINWSLLANFEIELKSLSAAGIKPIVILNHYPSWAAPRACGPVYPERLGDFAQFVRQVVARYKTSDFNAHVWELGNEPDIDPVASDLPADSIFGCWGNARDAFYGGGYYGEMLKVVGAAIRAEDPTAQIWIGGLLLDSPNTTASGMGKPEKFLQGILEAGAANYFDVVPYHAYTNYYNVNVDYDNFAKTNWVDLGGAILGKARYLRQLMGQYGVQKPLFVDEISLTCNDDPNARLAWCKSPGPEFYRAQANFLVRGFVRGLSENIMGYTWYTLEGPGWRNGGLLDPSNGNTPAYNAYKQLTAWLKLTTYAYPLNYGVGLEGYAFKKVGQEVDIVWAKSDQNLIASVPQATKVEAFTRDGSPIALGAPANGIVQVPVGFDPVYIIRTP